MKLSNLKLTLSLAFFLFLSLFTSPKSYAQIDPAGSTPSAYLDIHNYSYPCSTDIGVYSASTINCDMITTTSGDKFFVVGYTVEDNNMKAATSPWGPCFLYTNIPTPHSGIHLEHISTVPLQFAPGGNDLPIAGTNPDVAIGLAPLGTGGASYIGVVYESGNDVLFARVKVGVGTGFSPASIAYITPATVLSTPGRIAKSPHIEMFGEPTNWNSHYKCIITWTERDVNNIDYIMVAAGNLFSPSSFAITQITPSLPGDPEGITPDVAAMTVLNPCGGCDPYKAYLTYKDPNNGNALMLTELDIDALYAVTNITHTTLENGFTDIGNPRIESKALGDVVTGEVTWEVVASVQPTPSGPFEIHAFNDVTTVTQPTIFALSPADHHFSPVVTGVGEDMNPAITPTGVGETQFSIAYYSTYTHNPSGSMNGDVFANSVDISGGTASSTYYEVNDLDLYQSSSYSTANEIPVAIASSSNDGDDLLTVWFQGYTSTVNWGEIHWKLSGNNYSFKPTGSFNIAKDNIRIYPNPATEVLNIEGAGITHYTVYDVVGRVMNQGEVADRKHSLDISELNPGVYFLAISKGNATDKIKFIKR